MKSIIKHINSDKKLLLKIAFYVCIVIILGEILRDIFREGDFGGYISAGKLACNNLSIYSDFRNTWPPFFSIVCIPLYWLNELSFVGLRFIWLIAIVWSNLLIFKWIISYFTPYQLVLNLKQEKNFEVNLFNPLFILPFVCSLRIFLEELSNLQINVFILALSLVTLNLIIQKRDFLAGLTLALIISIKVYPIILVGFLIFKKRFKTVVYTIIGLGLTTLIVFLFFGLNTGIELFKEWNNTQVIHGLKCEHMNQSIWGWMCGLTTNHIRMEDLSYNIFQLTDIEYKITTLCLITILGFYVAYRFYTTRKIHQSFAKQFIITLSLIPILSPVAWKYYYVFVTPLIILLIYSYRRKLLNPWFYIPIIFISLTSELFVGHHLSDITETLGIITFCSITLSIYSLEKILTD